MLMLPNITTRRVTLDNTGVTGGSQTMSVTIDLLLENRLDDNGNGTLFNIPKEKRQILAQKKQARKNLMQ